MAKWRRRRSPDASDDADSGTAIIARTKTIQTGLIILNAASVKPYAAPATKYANDVAVPACNDNGEQGDPRPPQVQENLEVAVVSLVRAPRVNPPELFESLPEPETFKARPQQRVL